MTNEELNTALYKKMFAQQEAFREELLQMPPEEILRHKFETSYFPLAYKKGAQRQTTRK